MKICAHHEEVVQAIRAGQWPHGCTSAVREHVASCTPCAEQVRLLAAFVTARENAMRGMPSHTPELLWWKAQLRRRREIMERLERPGFAISTVTIAASAILLLAVLITVCRRLDWSRFVPAVPSSWNAGMVALVAGVLCGCAVVALVVGFGIPEKRG